MNGILPFPSRNRPLIRLMLAAALLTVQAHAAICFLPHDESSGRRAWSFGFGVAFITSNNVENFLSGELDIDDGPAGGEIYQLTISRRLGEFEWQWRGHRFRPQLELPVTLEIVDENSRAPFADINASVMLRWVDFPWNHRVATTVAMGLGLSYSSKVYLMDIQRHPDDDRSHLKLNWPIELTVAAPGHPEHQFSLFLIHQSGGRIFDRGGVNSLGAGYRRDF